MRTGAVVCALAVLLAGLGAGAALAQEQQVRLGVVDMDTVISEYQEYQASEAQYQEFLRQRERQLQERMEVRLLREEELREYQNLKAVVAPTPEQKARLEQLLAVARARESELEGLQRVAEPTEEQKQRLSELQAIAAASKAEVEQLRQRLSDEVNARNKELSDRLNQKIEAALAAVAREKRLDYIIRKEAVLFGGRDVTREVLAKLNAGAPAAGAAEAPPAAAP